MDEYHPKPASCKVDNDTWLIRFPSCDNTQALAEQSVREYLASGCSNFIIDIRGNGGGRDDSYQPLFQLLFDTPDCSRDGAMRRYTEASIKRCGLTEEKLKELSLPTDFASAPEYVVWVKDGATFHFDSISSFPKKAAIIIDNSVDSSGEELVLDARLASSRHVSMGETTQPAVSIRATVLISNPQAEISPFNIPCHIPRAGRKTHALTLQA